MRRSSAYHFAFGLVSVLVSYLSPMPGLVGARAEAYETVQDIGRAWRITFVGDEWQANPQSVRDIQAVLNRWSRTIGNPDPIRRINIRFTWDPTLANNILGSAGSTWSTVGNDAFTTIEEVWKLHRNPVAPQNGGSTSWDPTQFDSVIRYNPNFTWHFGTGAPTGRTYDFRTVVAHEIGHPMGFRSLFIFNDYAHGPSLYGATAWDKLMRLADGRTPLDFLNDPDNFPYEAGNGTVHWGGERGVAANNGRPIYIFTPDPYVGGSSMSHIVGTGGRLDTPDIGVPDALMQYSTSRDTRRWLLPVEWAMLMDMGWLINTYESLGANRNQKAVGRFIEPFINTASGQAMDVFDALDASFNVNVRLLQNGLDQMQPASLCQAYSDQAFSGALRHHTALEQRGSELRAAHLETGLDSLAFVTNLDSPLFADAGSGPVATDTPKAASPKPATPEKKFSLFASGYGHFANQDSDSDLAGFSYTTTGAVVGGDYRVAENFYVGLSANVGLTDGRLDQHGSTFEVMSGGLGAYAGFFTKKGVYASASLSGTELSYESRRRISLGVDPFVVRETAEGDATGRMFSASLGGGYDHKLGKWQLGPAVSVLFSRLSINAFRESRAGALNLHVDSQDASSLKVLAGGRVARPVSFKWGCLTPEVRARYVHEFLDDARDVTVALPGIGTGGFEVTTRDPSRGRALCGAGLSAQVGKKLTTFVNYEADVGGDKYMGHSVYGGVRVRF